MTVTLCACHGGAQQIDAANADAAIDADEGTGFRVAGSIDGVDDPLQLVLAVDAQADQTILVTEDGTWRFPHRLADQTSFTVRAVASQTCLPTSIQGTIAGANTDLALSCDGATELRALAFSAAVRLHPHFDPRAAHFTGDEPFLLESTDTMTVAPTPRYPDATVTVTSSPTPMDMPVQLQVARSGMSRTYRFDLARALLQEAYVKAGDTAALNANLGGAVAISGDTLVAGAPGVAKVYIYQRTGTTWIVHDTFLGVAGSSFGASVAIDGDDLVIGAPAEAGGGAAYVSHRVAGVWSPPTKLDPTIATTSFGAAVSISGAYLVVGAPQQTSTQGAVFVFHNAGAWALDRQFTAGTTGQFGAAVSISGTMLAVGAPANTSSRGTVFVFSGAAWSQIFSVTGATASDLLGTAVGLDGDLLVAGAPQEAVPAGSANQAGAVHLFRFTTSWNAETVLTATTPNPFPAADHFGFAVAVDRGHVIAGAPDEDCAGATCSGTASRSGAVYVFRKTTTWQQAKYVKAANGDAADGFGSSVSIDGDSFVAAAPNEDSAGTGIDHAPGDNSVTNAGAVYVFR